MTVYTVRIAVSTLTLIFLLGEPGMLATVRYVSTQVSQFVFSSSKNASNLPCFLTYCLHSGTLYKNGCGMGGQYLIMVGLSEQWIGS